MIDLAEIAYIRCQYSIEADTFAKSKGLYSFMIFDNRIIDFDQNLVYTCDTLFATFNVK